MALLICSICNKPVKGGEIVRALIDAPYVELKSSINHALDTKKMEVISPVTHADCYEKDLDE